MHPILLVLTVAARCFLSPGFDKGPAQSVWCSDGERHSEVHQADLAGSLLLAQQYDCPQGH